MERKEATQLALLKEEDAPQIQNNKNVLPKLDFAKSKKELFQALYEAATTGNYGLREIEVANRILANIPDDVQYNYDLEKSVVILPDNNRNK